MPHTVTTIAPSSAKKWSLDEDAKLLELRAAGKTWAAVARVLGRTEASAQARGDAIKKGKAKMP